MKVLNQLIGVITITAALSLQARAQSFLTNDLVAYYPFNGNANDASGNGNNGLIIGTDWHYTSNRFGYADSSILLNLTDPPFTSAGTYIAVPRSAALDFNQDFTLSVWVNIPNGLPAYQVQNLLGNGPDPTSANFRIISSADTNGDDYLQFVNLGGGLVDIHAFLAPLRNTWWQAILVRSGNNFSLFQNGSLVAVTNSAATMLNLPAIWLGGMPLSTNETQSYGEYPLEGGMDDVRMYNRALSSNEVQQLYAYESTPPPSFITNGLVAYYPFNGNANEATAQGSNGVVVNAGLTTDRFGIPNQAYAFDGATTWIQTTNYWPVLGSNAVTVSCWMYYTGGIPQPLAESVMLSWGGDINAGSRFQFSLHNGGGFTTLVMDSGGNEAVANTIIPTGQWCQVAVVLPANSAPIAAAFYLNGAQVPNVPGADTSYIFNFVPSDSLVIGHGSLSEQQASGRVFNGKLDDFRIYNRALSSNEIAELYAYESIAPPPTQPNVTSQPLPLTVNAGCNASFTVTAYGSPPLNYQWSLNSSNILGATNSSLTITDVSQCNLGAYAVVVTNAFGSVTSSNATLSMYPFLVTPFGGLVTDWGYTNTLAVQAWGTGPLTYQWFDNGVAIQNATNSTFNLPSIQFSNAGLYSVVVSNSFGSVTNTPEQVVVNPAGVSLGLYPGVTVSGVVGYTYNIQASTDLSNTNSWTNVATLTLLEPVQLWVDTTVNTTLPANPKRYYRVTPGP